MGSVTIRSERPSVWAALIAPLYHILHITGGTGKGRACSGWPQVAARRTNWHAVGQLLSRLLHTFRFLGHDMEYTYSLQKLAAYQPRKTKKSKETFDAGVALLNRGGFSGKGEEGARHANAMFSGTNS